MRRSVGQRAAESEKRDSKANIRVHFSASSRDSRLTLSVMPTSSSRRITEGVAYRITNKMKRSWVSLGAES